MKRTHEDFEHLINTEFEGFLFAKDFIPALVQAYNMGVEDATENAYLKQHYGENNGHFSTSTEVDKQSILNLIIK